ncbi:hypothetical protein L4C38_02485 [Vibrio kasasachensis]|uniref:hypothetical protein n=1 Tax=Vibrio kasasachensis TaxID=2910248 RepID=UPI003D099238
MKLLLTFSVVLQIGIALQTDGLYRALAELGAFVCVIALVVLYRKQKLRKVVIEPEEL